MTFTVQGGAARSSWAMPDMPELSPMSAPRARRRHAADTVFSTVPGAPVFVGKSPRYKSKNAKLGIDLDITGHNALQSTFAFQRRSAAPRG